MSKICVVLGSVREGRLGERVANLILQQLKEVGAVPTLLDPKVVDAPLLQQPLHFMKDPSAAPAWMQETHALLKDTEGFVIVTPEYNCSLPPALTNIFDYFPPASFRHKPASIVGYSMGPFGGIRSIALARPFLAELGMVALPSVVVIPTVQNAVDPEGTSGDERVLKNSAKLCKEIVWYAGALQAQQEKTGGNPN